MGSCKGMNMKKKNIFETTALKKIEQIKNLHMSHTTHHSVLLSSQGSNVKKALKKRHWPKTGKTSLINNNDVGTRSENQTVGPGQRPFLSRFADAADILSIGEILQLLGCRQPTKTFKSHVIHRKKSWHEHGQATLSTGAGFLPWTVTCNWTHRCIYTR